ncbi:MAG: DMT family transporter [SAR324 cluster bacterium]|nr:DMT family transporter [SAR324 cluster bacterium]MEC9460620.1 DMT family transporter [SAR324 cluster bacterium]MED5402395.1 DMT family transporter [SAR324 cluster bacterium]MEE3267126.1 DMT family transporter [SAR324 cluster bacterium]
MIIAELAALSAAFCWALSGLISISAIHKLGPLAFNRVRMSLVFLLLAGISFLTGAWREFPLGTIQTLMISGLFGIFLGDTALFGALQRLGPSRTSVIFALNAPMTVIMGWFILEEHLPWLTLLGCGVVTVGVLIAILGRRNSNEPQSMDSTQGRLRYGIALGLLAAFGQAAGSIIARPIMAEGVDPVTASAIRVGISALCLLCVGFIPNPLFSPKTPYTVKLIGIIMISGFLAMGIGMTLLLYALALGDAGVVTTLSATTPVLILPMLWVSSGNPPPLMAWVGAVVTLSGIVLITYSWV